MMSEKDNAQKPQTSNKRKAYMMAMGFAGLLIVFAYVALQEVRP